MEAANGRPTRWIGHVDMDSFFASVEIHDDPSLAGKPVVVGGPPEKRGVVAAASYESRKFGIHSAMPMARALQLCPGLVRVSPRSGRYKEVSDQVFGILRDFSPSLEPLSPACRFGCLHRVQQPLRRKGSLHFCDNIEMSRITVRILGSKSHMRRLIHSRHGDNTDIALLKTVECIS